jgi:hypothetical protein
MTFESYSALFSSTFAGKLRSRRYNLQDVPSGRSLDASIEQFRKTSFAAAGMQEKQRRRSKITSTTGLEPVAPVLL